MNAFKIKIFVERGMVAAVWANLNPREVEVSVHDADGDDRDEVKALEASLQNQDPTHQNWRDILEEQSL